MRIGIQTENVTIVWEFGNKTPPVTKACEASDPPRKNPENIRDEFSNRAKPSSQKMHASHAAQCEIYGPDGQMRTIGDPIITQELKI